MIRRIRSVLTACLLLPSSIAYCQGVSEQPILQQLLDLPELQQYFHVELPGRLPIKLLQTPGMPQGLQLEKFGRPVLSLTPAQAKQQATTDYISIRKLPARTTADTLMYTLAYPIEGVLCRARFVRKKAAWIMYDYSLVEQ